jgi:ribosomal protein S18 acetylase RimI-like enzyme
MFKTRQPDHPLIWTRISEYKMNTQSTYITDKPQTRSKKLDIKIREMEIDDLAPVFHLGETLFDSDTLPTMYRTWDDYEVTGFFNEDPEFCLVAEHKDRIIGFALGTIIIKSRSAWKYGYLIWLGVDPAFQKQGVGEKLYLRFQDLMIAEGVRMLMMDTSANDIAALKFFKKLGFNQPHEQIYMTLNLDNHRKSRSRKTKPAK